MTQAYARLEGGTMLGRRRFLRLGGMSLVLFGGGGFAGRTQLGQGVSRSEERDGVLVVFFQRGAADGLHMVVPYRDRRYRTLRGPLALSEPGKSEEATLDLGDGFALHPALAALQPLYKAGELAIVHAVGSPDPTRSHFDAQDYMESGTPGRKSTRDGWLSRALGGLDEVTPSPFKAVALTSSMPRALAGAADAIAMADFSRMATGERDAALAERIQKLYGQDADPQLAHAGGEASRAIQMFREKAPLSQPERAGVRYPRGQVARSFRQLARLIKAELGVRVAFLESGGWDTHFAQGGATGQMANRLKELAGSIVSFLQDVGNDVPLTLMTMTEFGRTVAINGAGGTDHGHGTAMLVAGQGVRGGRLLGDWLGLEAKNLYDGRDLPVTTDFRDLFGEVARGTLSLPYEVELFPGHRAGSKLGVMA